MGPERQPNDGDNVSITQSAVQPIQTNIYYANTLYRTASLNSFTLDATGLNDTITLRHYLSHPLAARNVSIGFDGRGSYIHSGGSLTVSNSLYLGYNNGASGAYQLSGSGRLTVFDEYLGRDGQGAFTQTGGTHIVKNKLNFNSGTGFYYNSFMSTYSLSAGSLSAVAEVIGDMGLAVFNHSGGVHTVGTTLRLGGHDVGANGFYNLSGAGRLTASDEHIVSDGVFTQTGGANTVKNDLKLGLHNGPTATYIHSGGTTTVGNTLYVGYLYDGAGAYELSGTGRLTALGEVVGDSGPGTFTQTGGSSYRGK